jgi:hypothetical protein
LRDRHERDEVTPHGMAVATGSLENRFDDLLSRTFRIPQNVRFANHLRHEQPYLFTFLHCPGLDGTNNVGERALRPAVVAGKVWGGNRTWNGARTQEILMSVLRTCSQQGKDAFASLVRLLRFPGVTLLEIVPTANPPPLAKPSRKLPSYHVREALGDCKAFPNSGSQKRRTARSRYTQA